MTEIPNEIYADGINDRMSGDEEKKLWNMSCRDRERLLSGDSDLATALRHGAISEAQEAVSLSQPLRLLKMYANVA